MTERDRARLSTYAGGERTTVDFPSDSIWVSGETGLLGLEVDPDYADNGRIYTCQGWRRGNGTDPKLTPAQQAALFAALQADPPDGGLWSGPKVAAMSVAS